MLIDVLYQCLWIKGDDNTIKGRHTLNGESMWLTKPSEHFHFHYRDDPFMETLYYTKSMPLNL